MLHPVLQVKTNTEQVTAQTAVHSIQLRMYSDAYPLPNVIQHVEPLPHPYPRPHNVIGMV